MSKTQGVSVSTAGQRFFILVPPTLDDVEDYLNAGSLNDWSLYGMVAVTLAGTTQPTLSLVFKADPEDKPWPAEVLARLVKRHLVTPKRLAELGLTVEVTETLEVPDAG